MSLLDQLVTRVAGTVDDRAEAWLDKGIEKAREAIDARDEDIDRALAEDGLLSSDEQRVARLERDLLRAAGPALDAIEARKGALAALGRARFAAVMVQLGAGREHEARLVALATSSTFAERRAASHASTTATLEAAEARAQAWREVQELAKEVGLMALRAALPLLLAAL